MPPAFIPATSLDWGTKGFAYALEQAHLPGLLIAGVLLVLSILSWSVMASKIALMSQASQRNYRFVYAFRKTKEPLELHDKSFNLAGAPLFSVYRAGARELALHLEQMMANEVHTPGSHMQARKSLKVTPDQMESVRSAMDRSIGEAVLTFENRMNMLATAVSGAPFLGLLGTVWGVMETFSGIAGSSSSASIQDMAPGVASALVTTVIGLLVAIPAMFGYNFLVNRIRTNTLEMHNFASELAARFERDYVDFRPAAMAIPVAVAAEPNVHVPGPAPMDVTAPVPLQVTAPVPIYRPPELGGSPFGRVPPPVPLYPPPSHASHTGYPAAGHGAMEPESTWHHGGSGGPPINPIAQQAAFQSQRERETDQEPHPHERPQAPWSQPHAQRPGGRTS